MSVMCLCFFFFLICFLCRTDLCNLSCGCLALALPALSLSLLHWSLSSLIHSLFLSFTLSLCCCLAPFNVSLAATTTTTRTTMCVLLGSPLSSRLPLRAATAAVVASVWMIHKTCENWKIKWNATATAAAAAARVRRQSQDRKRNETKQKRSWRRRQQRRQLTHNGNALCRQRLRRRRRRLRAINKHLTGKKSPIDGGPPLFFLSLFWFFFLLTLVC